MHGTLSLLGFERAVFWRDRLAWALVVLVAFAIFWHITTGEWRQYVPTLHRLRDMLRFYLVGIFRKEPHPVKKTELSKLNPLQRLTYLGLKLLVIPLQVVTGFVYLYYNRLDPTWLPSGVGPVALLHTIGAFVLLVFLVVHVYLTTTGRTPLSNIRAMITGWEDLEQETEGSRPD